jgi:hypothetical protein
VGGAPCAQAGDLLAEALLHAQLVQELRARRAGIPNHDLSLPAPSHPPTIHYAHVVQELRARRRLPSAEARGPGHPDASGAAGGRRRGRGPMCPRYALGRP